MEGSGHHLRTFGVQARTYRRTLDTDRRKLECEQAEHAVAGVLEMHFFFFRSLSLSLNVNVYVWEQLT